MLNIRKRELCEDLPIKFLLKVTFTQYVTVYYE